MRIGQRRKRKNRIYVEAEQKIYLKRSSSSGGPVEFFLIPLLAIAAVTLCIYKLAELVFHIHLACSLLMLLVGFAWLISLVLPGLFFHSAGFAGSLGLSFVSALGFAWVATMYDTKIQTARAVIDTEVPTTDGDQTDEVLANENIVLQEQRSTDEYLFEGNVPEERSLSLVEVIPKQPGFPPQNMVQDQDSIPLTTEELSGEDSSIATNFVNDKFPVEALTDAPPYWDENLHEEEWLEPATLKTETIAAMFDVADEDGSIAGEQPASDSLEDLLEFAFWQRSRNNPGSALETFRLIKHLYLESDALPMVVAEIVSTLQSQGDYDGAARELVEILHKPEIQNQSQVAQVFERKLAELLAETGGATA
jgi:hypothetical protein